MNLIKQNKNTTLIDDWQSILEMGWAARSKTNTYAHYHRLNTHG